jgi:hypothetical protein
MKKDCEIFNGSKRNDIDLLGLNIFLHFFVLIQKNEAKKIKTVPASLNEVAI